MDGYAIGRLIGFFLVPVLLLALLGAIQYARTRDRASVTRTVVSWWALTLVAACLVVGLVAQFVAQIP